MSESLVAEPGGTVRGRIRVPGDKSVSHRSIMLGSLADGVTEVTGFLEGEDALATRNVFRAMGVRIDGPDEGRVTVHGVGMEGLKAPVRDLDCGNSGTSMRLLCGLLAGQDFESRLIGDSSLTRRPMKRVIEPLSRMGARIDSSDGRPPLVVHGSGLRGELLKGVHVDMSVASAQVKSAILLAGLRAEGEISVTEPAITRDHTERMLGGFGVKTERDGMTVRLKGGQRLKATRIEVPADISSAAFFLVAACVTPGADLWLEGVGVNPTRIGILHILRMMGAHIEEHDRREVGGEPVCDLHLQYRPLKGIAVPEQWVPLAIDEFPALFVAACCAQGTTTITGADELRVKESDRIATMAAGFEALDVAGHGVGIEVLPDGMRIDGVGEKGMPFGPGTVDSHGDHRIAMSFAVASLRASGRIQILDTANVNTSFPGFATLATQAGLRVTAVGAQDKAAQDKAAQGAAR